MMKLFCKKCHRSEEHSDEKSAYLDGWVLHSSPSGGRDYVCFNCSKEENQDEEESRLTS